MRAWPRGPNSRRSIKRSQIPTPKQVYLSYALPLTAHSDIFFDDEVLNFEMKFSNHFFSRLVALSLNFNFIRGSNLTFLKLYGTK